MITDTGRSRQVVSNSRNPKFMAAGIAFTLVVLSGPFDSLSDANLTVHMIQHLVLFVGSAIFGYGLERYLFSKLLALRKRTYIGWKIFTSVMRFNSKTRGLLFALVVPAVVFSYWHYPPNFDLAVVNENVHILEHLCYIISGSLVGLSIVAITRKLRYVLVYVGFMQAGMMSSMMLVWPSFFPIYSAAQNTDMETFLMMFGAVGVVGLGSYMLKAFDVI
ncbi:MAG: cytochrome c oxidase assembly protein [Nitrososphaerota archaeon]|nr:cytochrome c oxidase assembly protein [Nitrososphaerota archaeon]